MNTKVVTLFSVIVCPGGKLLFVCPMNVNCCSQVAYSVKEWIQICHYAFYCPLLLTDCDWSLMVHGAYRILDQLRKLMFKVMDYKIILWEHWYFSYFPEYALKYVRPTRTTQIKLTHFVFQFQSNIMTIFFSISAHFQLIGYCLIIFYMHKLCKWDDF